MKSYQDRITSAIASTKWASADPAIVECWMRLEHRTLDALDAKRFAAEACAGARMTIEHPIESADLAESYGLAVMIEAV